MQSSALTCPGGGKGPKAGLGMGTERGRSRRSPPGAAPLFDVGPRAGSAPSSSNKYRATRWLAALLIWGFIKGCFNHRSLSCQRCLLAVLLGGRALRHASLLWVHSHLPPQPSAAEHTRPFALQGATPSVFASLMPSPCVLINHGPSEHRWCPQKALLPPSPPFIPRWGHGTPYAPCTPNGAGMSVRCIQALQGAAVSPDAVQGTPRVPEADQGL